MGQHVDYFHLSPVILTDALFFQYNPTILVTGTQAQRTSAYLMAEQEMMQHLETFLLPTTVTGTYLWPLGNPIRLDHGYVSSVDRIVVQSFDGLCNCDITENTACAVIREGWGLIDGRVTSTAVRAGCGSCQAHGGYYNALITYTAGIPTGTAANDSALHMGLSKIAQIHLNEICDPGANEGGPGNPGLSGWSALGTSETRMPLKSFPFGSDAIANYVARLVRHLKKIRPLRF
jgi:hypothetical protein